MKRYEISIILNVLVIILEIAGLIAVSSSLKVIDFSYYTIDSNIFAFITSVLYLIYRKKDSNALSLLKYASTVSVMLTFIVVVLVLLPMYDFNFRFLFLDNGGMYLHVLCPLIALISFIFFENHDIENIITNNIYATLFTIIYAIILISLNIMNIVVGPYPFLKVNEQPVILSVFWIVVMLGGTLVLSRMILMLNDLYGIFYS